MASKAASSPRTLGTQVFRLARTVRASQISSTLFRLLKQLEQRGARGRGVRGVAELGVRHQAADFAQRLNVIRGLFWRRSQQHDQLHWLVVDRAEINRLSRATHGDDKPFG